MKKLFISYTYKKLNEIIITKYKGSLECIAHIVIAEEVPIFHTFHYYVRLVGMCFFRIAVLFEVSVTVTSELLKTSEHLILNKPIRCLIVEIKHEKALHSTEHHTLALLT